ncbi:MAG: hypothetical protein H0W20_11485 [Chthoniobacterales bacterium]|nr:hypothetical protein [Chthoniobacterales bacterium]
MKPTFQTRPASRRGQSQRPQGQNVSKSPSTDWSFQASAPSLHSGAAPLLTQEEVSPTMSLYKLSEAFSATDSRESRFEIAFFGVIIALGAWPIAHALHIAVHTVG